MTLLTRLTTVISLVVLAMWTAPAANAEVLGGVDVVPEKGNVLSLISVVTERGCAAPAERVSAVVYGKGLPKEGQVVVSPSELLFSTTRPMELPLSNAFVIYAERNSTALNGTYQLKVLCTDRIGFTVIDEFVTTMTWKTPGGFGNIDEATYVAKSTAKVVTKDSEAAEPAPGASAAPPVAPDGASPDASPEASEPTAPSSGERPLANEERADGSNPSVDGLVAATQPAAEAPTTQRTFWILIGLTAVLVLALGLFARSRRTTDTPLTSDLAATP